MINRYFTQNALVSGPLEFLAGFGQRRQEIHNTEAGYEAQQNRQLEQSLGQGIQQAGQGIGAGLARAGQNRQDMQLLQMRGQQALDFENQRSANDMLQVAEAARFRALGVPGAGRQSAAFDPMQAGLPFEAVMPGAEYGGQLGPAAPGSIAAPMPLQEAPPPPPPNNTANLDPMNVQAYQRASTRLAELNTEYDNIMTSQRPPSEKYSAVSRLIPAIAEQRQLQQRYQRPPPPSTAAELRAAGANNGGYTELDDGTRAFRDPDGSWKFSAPTKKSEEDRPIKVAQPDGTVTEVDADVYALPDTGVITRKGVQYHAPPKAAESKISQEYDDTAKLLTTKDEDGTHIPGPEKVKQYIRDKKAAIEELESGKLPPQPPAEPVVPEESSGPFNSYIKSLIGANSGLVGGLVPQQSAAVLDPQTPEDAKAVARRTLAALRARYPNGSQVPPEIAQQVKELAEVLRK